MLSISPEVHSCSAVPGTHGSTIPAPVPAPAVTSATLLCMLQAGLAQKMVHRYFVTAVQRAAAVVHQFCHEARCR